MSPTAATGSVSQRGGALASRGDDLTIVRIGDERYEIPDAVALGD
jgi:hypothetical protein